MPSVPDRLVRSKSDEAAIDQGCRFDQAAADRVRYFFERFLRHSKGQFAGRRFELLPWQWERVVEPCFGWKMPNGTRRFRRVACGIPKKNGKSTLLAGLGLYLLVGDGEPGAEVYSAAADRKQASIIFNEAAKMVRASPALYRRVRLREASKSMQYGNSAYEALSAEVETKEGYNVHGLLFDELHAQATPRLWNALRFGGASRRQPLIFWISTAGVDRESICHLQWQMALDVQESRAIDIGLLPCIFAATDKDDPFDEEVWKRANPSYGCTISERDMREAADEARAKPFLLNNFLRYRLNLWTEQVSKWHATETWDKCRGDFDEDHLRRQRCWAGLDLASTTDLAALCLLFPPGAKWRTLFYFWAPKSALKTRERANRQRLDHWVQQGLIRLTPGNCLDYGQIRSDMNRLAKRFVMREVGIDPWNATSLATDLAADGFDVEYVRQGFHTMNAAVKELEKLLLACQIEHDGNAVARWMFNNLTMKTDPAGNVKPDKGAATDKIDGIVALLVALSRAIQAAKPKECVYNKRKVRFV